MAGRRTIVVLAALALAASAAPARASDASATHTYIQANYALTKVAVANVPAVQAKVKALNSQLAQQCPRVGAGAPELEVTQPLSSEVVVALWSLAYTTNAGAISKFLAATRGLHWSDSRLTRSAARRARGLHELATLPLPDLCADVRAFAASGFHTAPPAVVALVDRVESINIDPPSPRLLAPFVHGADASTLARTRRLEHKLEGQEIALGQDDWIEVLETLDLPQ